MPTTHTIYAVWHTRADPNMGDDRSISLWFDEVDTARTCYDVMQYASNVGLVMLFDDRIGVMRSANRQADGRMKEKVRYG
jgi:hypothetical protein